MELTAIIPKSEYYHRQRILCKTIDAQGIVIIPAAQAMTRNRDVQYPFRQDSDFWYLTGFLEPEAVAVWIPGRQAGEYLLFCRPRDPAREQWVGTRAGIEGAIARYGVNQAYPINELDTHMPDLLVGRKVCYYPIGNDLIFDARVINWIKNIKNKARSGAIAPEILINLDSVLHEQRLYKNSTEIAVLRHAANISAQAQRQLMKICTPGMRENELAHEFQHLCAIQGARHLAYATIVASGAHACILHYTENSEVLNAGDLVLIDAGCEFEGYAADITRTFPINGHFTEPQLKIYKLVLQAQEAILAHCRPGVRWDQLQETAVRVLTKGLIELGILTGKVNNLIRGEAYKTYYMHSSGHWLGMDVHDVGLYRNTKGWRRLAPGMVFTVEPGLYLPIVDSIPAPYRGIGVRIEDEILITAKGYEILSAGVPKDPVEIETLMNHTAVTV